MSEITITGASLKSASCDYSYVEPRDKGFSNKINNKCDAIIHDDLRNAFKKLAPHLAFICEEVATEKVKDIDAIEPYEEGTHKENGIEHKISMFSVDSIAIKGTGENQGVIVQGSKMLSTGDFVALSSPKIKYEDTQYRFVGELRVAVDDLIEEVRLYHEGKVAPAYEQTEMEFNEDPEEE